MPCCAARCNGVEPSSFVTFGEHEPSFSSTVTALMWPCLCRTEIIAYQQSVTLRRVIHRHKKINNSNNYKKIYCCTQNNSIHTQHNVAQRCYRQQTGFHITVGNSVAYILCGCTIGHITHLACLSASHGLVTRKLYMVSYYRPIVTLCVKCTVFEIFAF